jgi:hypothetical protein
VGTTWKEKLIFSGVISSKNSVNLEFPDPHCDESQNRRKMTKRGVGEGRKTLTDLI